MTRVLRSGPLALIVALTLALASAGAAQTHIVIMHTNDIHGHLQPENGAGGLEMVAAIVKREHPDLLLDAGDMFTGTLLTDNFYGEPVMAVMNRMGYDATIIGNHEFDYGLGMLRTRVNQAKLPVLSANVVFPFNDVQKTKIVEAKGIRFGIIGLTTMEAATTTHPKNLKNVQIIDLIKALETNLPQLRARSDFIIVLGHLTTEEEQRIARTFPEIRLIIGGHIHTPLKEPIMENGTMIVRNGAFGQSVGRLDLDFEDRKFTKISEKFIEVKGIPPDPDAVKAVEPFRAKVQDKMDAVLGVAAAPLLKTNSDESPLFNMITDAYRAKTGTQMAMANPGGIRTSLPAGPITYGKIFEILPFENTLVTMKITGAAVKRSLAVDITAISGVRAVFDPSKPKNQRLASATLADGSPIIDDAIYTVTVNDFMQAGGDGYDEFTKGADTIDTGIRLRDIVSEYITAHKTINPVTDGRVQILK